MVIVVEQKVSGDVVWSQSQGGIAEECIQYQTNLESVLIVYSIAVGLYAIYRTEFCVRGCDIARGEAEGYITTEDTKRGPI